MADDKLTYTYVPEIIRYYLNEEPILPNVETYRLEDPDHLAHVLDHLDELVLKPVAGAGGYGILIGPQADERDLAEARAAVAAEPRAWIAQDLVTLSTAPTSSGHHLAPRHLDLRPFAVNDGRNVWVLPGGLTRVALREGSLVVNSSQGGGSKDTWVTLGHQRPPRGGQPQSARVASPSKKAGFPEAPAANSYAGRRPEPGPGLDDSTRQQQQQQQQQQAPPEQQQWPGQQQAPPEQQQWPGQQQAPPEQQQQPLEQQQAPPEQQQQPLEQPWPHRHQSRPLDSERRC